jgi:type III secretion system FlhB-like substrate exporter
VTAVNDNTPVITSGATANVAENTTAVMTVTATDADLPAQTLTYSIVGGADAAKFAINSSTGALSFATAPDYEAPTDVGSNNVYDVTVQASDGTLSSTKAIAVTVTAVNDNTPVITSGATANVAENTTAVMTVTATDADLPAQTLTYSIVGGADAAKFAINASTGALSFATAPDYEAPTDVGSNNVYDVTVQASDGTLSSTKAIAVTVTAVNDNTPVITSAATASVAENTTAVMTVTATDSDQPAQTLSFSIAGGADAAKFTINASTGALSFISAPDFETPTDAGGNNIYDVTVQVADGQGGTDSQAIAVTVTSGNDNAPVITSGATASVAENTTAVMTVTATDADLPAQTLTYSIMGGADAAKFAINSSTGALSFVSAPDFETPTDAGGDNVYDVTVQVADGQGSTDSLAIAVTVTSANDNAPVITSGSTASVAENTTAVMTVTATDSDQPAQTLSFSIVGGADAAKFTINASTGALSFLTTPDYETPTDAGGNNIYDVTVQVSDGQGSTDSEAIAVTVTSANDNAPVITSGATASVAENTTAVMTVTATDADLPAQTLTYSIMGGADAAKFAINSSTGALSFVSAPDFETPTDAGGDNVYDVTVQVSDGQGSTDSQAIAVTVTSANDNAPVITSGATASVAENTTAVMTVTATDSDQPSQTLSFSIVGGADAAKFTINASTGALSFLTTPDYETPTDAGGNNIYDVTVQVSDGQGSTDSLAIAVTVTSANENAPVITSGSTASVAENTTAVMTVTATDSDQPAQTLSFSIVGGADAAKFTINASTGALSFVSAPDFETPTDAGGDNVYDVTVQVADGQGSTDSLAIAVTVTSANDNAPVITSGSTASVAENTTAVMTVTATDSDQPAQTLSFSIVGGADAAKFTINASTGALSFLTTPDYETPTDAGGNNIYDVTVQVSDGQGSTDSEAIAVTVTSANDNAPVITSGATANVAENTTAVMTVTATDADQPAQSLSFSIVGGADAAKFAINSSTGALSFISAPDFETPTDAGGNNIYDVTVQVSDGQGSTDSEAIAVTVTSANDNAPVITSGATASVAENTTAVMTVTATDADQPAQTLSYSIMGGADAAKFAINASTGALSFISAPDFESPTDAGGDNVYDVIVEVADGQGSTDSQAIAVTVTSANDNAPVITSGSTASVAENTTAVMTVTATDADQPAQTLSFSIVGGADAGKFAINSSTGALSFLTAPDFETPTDAGGDNVYDVTVQVSDGQGSTDSQAIAVTVTAGNDNAPVITSGATASVAENTTAVMTVTATDADQPAQTLSYSIIGGADAAKFAINSSTGALSFLAAPDFETPTDAGGDNVYDVTIQVSDGQGSTDSQAIAVTVTAGNDNAPVITSGATASVAENTTAVMTVTATDADQPAQTLSYSIIGGADAAKFAINSSTGALSFLAAPDFETPTDAGGDNVYDVTVQVSDGQGSTDSQAIAVTVTSANDNAPVITSGATASVAENTTAVMTVTATDSDQPAQT